MLQRLIHKPRILQLYFRAMPADQDIMESGKELAFIKGWLEKQPHLPHDVG